MKKLFLLITLFVFSQVESKACIVYKNIQPDSTLKMDASTQFGNGVIIDINNDGTNDCSFIWYWFSGFGWQMSITGDTSNVSYIVEQDTLQFGEKILTPLSTTDTVKANANWGASEYGNAIADSNRLNFAGKGDKYIGIRLKVNGKTYYGWVLVSFDSAANNRSLTVKSYAFNNAVDMPIIAGDTGTAITTIMASGKGGQDTLLLTHTLQMETNITPANAYSSELAWSVDDTSLASISATGLLTAKKVGAVKVTVSDSCSGMSDDTTITIKPLPVGITKQHIMSQGIKLYPNPVNDVLHIEKDASQDYKEVLLYTMEGKHLLRNSFTNSVLDINMKDLPTGLYFVVLTDEHDLKHVMRVEKR